MPATPLSHWIGFHILLIVLLAMELLYARRPSRREPDAKQQRTSIVATILWIAAALAFGGWVWQTRDGAQATQFLAGYAIEEALSIDNLFVFLLLFKLFQIRPVLQPRVLFWGVAGAIVMRGGFIAAGLGLLEHFHWISYVFGAILLFAAIRLVMPEKEEEEARTPGWVSWLSRIHPVSMKQDCFFTVENGRRVVTMLFLCLVAIELTDVVFALDSIPAVLSITRDPFLAYTSNILAVMGLRSLFFLLANLLKQLRFLHYGLAAILGFAAFKMLAARMVEVGPLVSLAVIVGMLAITIGLSLAVPKRAA
ncbi:tellurite resistance protein TerC [Granulicella rosea]|uniref:Tellurite resistance protein TerC n=1 Tax=Granulicella rosea TaxID=474952 RepID=A0A239E3A1_9BACT|nr:TerC/Alx family metal homeostasis membrane protein [Granulicella rosea]SNS39210.1 tellurite resistance protein TerC [Granulicella rosea]